MRHLAMLMVACVTLGAGFVPTFFRSEDRTVTCRVFEKGALRLQGRGGLHFVICRMPQPSTVQDGSEWDVFGIGLDRRGRERCRVTGTCQSMDLCGVPLTDSCTVLFE